MLSVLLAFFKLLLMPLKYIFKEIIIPASANKVVFILAPIVTMTLALVAWAVIPMSENLVLSDINVGILYLFAVSSLGVYGIIMGGWASNSKYPFLGAIRSAAQMVSYEVSIGIIIINVLLCVGSLNLNDIVISSKRIMVCHTFIPNVCNIFYFCILQRLIDHLLIYLKQRQSLLQDIKLNTLE